VFTRIAAGLVPTGVQDTQCAMKVFTARAARDVFADLATDGFAFDVEVLARARKLGLRVDEVPVAWTHQAGSSLNPLVASGRMLR
jgi:hypothetical protein